MKVFRFVIGFLMIAFVFHDSLFAQANAKRRGEKQGVEQEVVPRRQARAAQNAPPVETKQLWGIDWYPDVPSALRAALGTDVPAQKDGALVDNTRPVMWFRVLGDLDGFM